MIKNTAEFDAISLAAIFSPDDLINVSSEEKYKSVFTDSRKCLPGSIFAALKGENTDGHSYIGDAFSNGAEIVLASKKWYAARGENYPDKKFILTDDTLTGLHRLAKFHRERFSIPIVAVAGSNGKTGSKEMIADVLGRKYKVLRTFENFNNQIGVPLMLLAINNSHEVCVLELGTNMPGEIAILSEMVAPTHGIITNIGKEHLELLEDLDGVESEETSLFGYLYGKGTAFINLDDERLKKYTAVQDSFFTYGTSEEANLKFDYSLADNSLQPSLTVEYKDKRISVDLNTYGKFSALNAAAASAVGFAFGLAPESIEEGLRSFRPVTDGKHGRMAVEKHGDITIINDCYNSNPGSALGALNDLKTLKAEGSKTVVLGDMLELGKNAGDEHKNVLETAIDSAENILVYGKNFSDAARRLNNSKIEAFDSKEELAKKLISITDRRDVILVKASRGMKGEEIISRIKNN